MAVQEFKPQILGFLCNWCSYAGADLCGVSPPIPPHKVSGDVLRRMDLEFVLRASQRQGRRVYRRLLAGGMLHHRRNYDALSMMHLGKLLEYGSEPGQAEAGMGLGIRGNRLLKSSPFTGR
jgi:hypothetical protein